MKISIIFGVIHMIFGVMVGLCNHRYFKNKMAIYCEFIPQIIFLVFLFFYMVLMMFIKWVRFSASNDGAFSENCAPSILITFINMVLMKSVDWDPETDICSPYMFSGQAALQKFLVIVAVLCIPWMLLAKPILIARSRKNEHHQPIVPVENGDAENGLNAQSAVAQQAPAGGHEEEEEMSEIYIHQGIHTIEYVLGSISHTASYLRLWALSLAHAQLSEVLWNMVLQVGLKQDGWVGGVVLWVVSPSGPSLRWAFLSSWRVCRPSCTPSVSTGWNSRVNSTLDRVMPSSRSPLRISSMLRDLHRRNKKLAPYGRISSKICTQNNFNRIAAL
uniref:V-type proton ATPase subunit a n=1 Tax=Lutzomyia longipalpis TaxID=7200 RepID=A0A7G3B7A9_LUTLO